MKKYMLSCLLILLLSAVIVPGSAVSHGAVSGISEGAAELPGEEIRQQLSRTGSTLEQIQLNGWAKINDRYMSLPALEDLAAESLNVLGSGLKAEVCSNGTEQIRNTELHTEYAGVRYTLSYKNEKSANNGERNYHNESDSSGKQDVYETYIIAEAIIYDVENVKEAGVYARLKSLLAMYCEKPCIRTSYTAAIPGELTLNRMERINRQIFHGLEGKITEAARDGGWISKTGYSSKIGCAMDSSGKQINLNIALRYNAYYDKTYVWLGTPVISIPY
jgi:hypothetical protein